MKIITKIAPTIFIIILLLLFLKVDYRILNELICCGDDFDYYSHAYTIAVDFDFDYSNQLIQNHSETYTYKDKVAPLGFVGSGILSSPFLFIGNLFDKIFFNSEISNKILIYSFSSIFYLLLGANLLFISLKKIERQPNFIFIFIVMFGSGLGYFSFERYSMTHVYEVFTISLLFFIFVNIYKDNSKYTNLFIALMPFAVALCFLVRFTNYYIILLPYIFRKLFFNNENRHVYLNKYFITSAMISVGLFITIINSIYGRVTLNPTQLYFDDQKFQIYLNQISSFQTFFMYNFNIFKTFVFSQEFGILYFNPVVFAGFVISLMLIFNKKYSYLLNLLVIICFLSNFAIIGMWKSTASSYGYRYLLSLVALSIILFYSQDHSKFYKYFYYYIFFFSIFGSLSILFFESTTLTQLSTNSIVNSFNNEVPFSNPNYLSGFLYSILDINSYIKIIGNSFLFAFVIQIFGEAFGFEKLYEVINSFFGSKLPDDFELYFIKIENIPGYQFLVIFIFIYLISLFIKEQKK
tara:strand:+ start:15786 stop:17351 length:1566 start_codon:yes stop_codon:yes gene_type:complete